MTAADIALAVYVAFTCGLSFGVCCVESMGSRLDNIVFFVCAPAWVPCIGCLSFWDWLTE
jgi:hypothetical protein